MIAMVAKVAMIAMVDYLAIVGGLGVGVLGWGNGEMRA